MAATCTYSGILIKHSSQMTITSGGKYFHDHILIKVTLTGTRQFSDIILHPLLAYFLRCIFTSNLKGPSEKGVVPPSDKGRSCPTALPCPSKCTYLAQE